MGVHGPAGSEGDSEDYDSKRLILNNNYLIIIYIITILIIEAYSN